MKLLAPEKLTAEHNIAEFECEHLSMTNWLLRRALDNQSKGASQCYVVCDDEPKGKPVVGFYSLSAGSVEHVIAPRALKKNMPNPIPVVLLGRLAVHTEYQRRGIGVGMLKDAILRSIRAAQGIGAAALLCHAIDANARDFYLKHGFVRSPVEDLTVMLGLRALV